MITKIRDADERSVYLNKIDEISRQLDYQKTLPKDAQINSFILLKLQQLKRFLEYEVEIYDKLDEF